MSDFYDSEFARLFRAGFARWLAEIEADSEATVPVAFDVDTGALREQLGALGLPGGGDDGGS